MFRVLVTNLEDPPEEIWRDYNQRVFSLLRVFQSQHRLEFRVEDRLPQFF
jgi:hypothetical protein